MLYIVVLWECSIFFIFLPDQEYGGVFSILVMIVGFAMISYYVSADGG